MTNHLNREGAEQKQPLQIPAFSENGRRFLAQLPAYKGTEIFHAVCLPHQWEKNKKYPVLVEYTGNYSPPSGSSGRIEDASLGYGLTGGENFIWVVLPYVGPENKPALTWWGDESATVEYARAAVPFICEKYSGDSENVFLCGFSRGAIAVSYIGLHDEKISRLWKGFITHDHFNGVRQWPGTAWGGDLAQYRQEAAVRIKRGAGRPMLIMQNPNTQEIQDYLHSIDYHDGITFLNIPMQKLFGEIPNRYFSNAHTDKWMLFDHGLTEPVRKWLLEQR